jgi:hypothetical protein
MKINNLLFVAIIALLTVSCSNNSQSNKSMEWMSADDTGFINHPAD